MNCPECQERLQRRLDGAAAAPTGELDRHLADCPDCRAQFAAAARLLDGLRALPRVQPPADLTRRIVAGVLQDRELRRARARRRVFVTLALAASIVILLLFGYFGMTGRPPEHDPPAVANNQPPEPKPNEPAPELRPEEVRVALAGATEKLADRAFEQMRMFVSAATPPALPAAGLPKVPELEPLDAEATQSLREAGHEVSEGLQTVTRTARRAIDYFSRDLPMFDLPREN